MDTRDILVDAYGRIREIVHDVTDGLDAEALAFRPDADANSIGWLIWHLTRVQDDHVSEIAGHDQAWITWAQRFTMEPDPTNTGYGHSTHDVAAVKTTAEDLRDYHDAVHDRTLTYLETIDAEELERIIDYGWDPPPPRVGGRPAGQRHRRRPATRRPSCLCARPHGAAGLSRRRGPSGRLRSSQERERQTYLNREPITYRCAFVLNVAVAIRSVSLPDHDGNAADPQGRRDLGRRITGR